MFDSINVLQLSLPIPPLPILPPSQYRHQFQVPEYGGIGRDDCICLFQANLDTKSNTDIVDDLISSVYQAKPAQDSAYVEASGKSHVEDTPWRLGLRCLIFWVHHKLVVQLVIM